MTAGHAPVRPTSLLPARVAWLRTLGMAAVLWLVMGVACFGVGASAIHARFGTSVHAAFLLDMLFAVACLALTAITVWWLRRTGSTVADLGWRRPTTRAALVAAVVFGVLWTALSYSAGGDPWDLSWQRIPMVVAGPILALGEETARAFIIRNLHLARVPVWAQIVVAGLVMGSYHGVVGGHFTLVYTISSFVMFTLLSALYVWGRRSLTPVLLAHALPHVLGDPSLTQGILFGLQAMGG